MYFILHTDDPILNTLKTFLGVKSPVLNILQARRNEIDIGGAASEAS